MNEQAIIEAIMNALGVKKNNGNTYENGNALNSPVPEPDTLDTQGKVNYVDQNQQHEQGAAQYNQGVASGAVPTPTAFPPFQINQDVANAPQKSAPPAKSTKSSGGMDAAHVDKMYHQAIKGLLDLRQKGVPVNDVMNKLEALREQHIAPNLPQSARSIPDNTNNKGNFWTKASQVPGDLVNQFEDAVSQAVQQYGIHPAAMKSLAALETNTGTGRQPVGYAARNNFYNIGAFDSNPNNAYSYATPKEGVDAFVKLVSTSPRYSKAWAVRNDPVKFGQELKNAGYATDPNYVSKYMSTPEFYKNVAQAIPTAKPITPTPTVQKQMPKQSPVSNRQFVSPIPSNQIVQNKPPNMLQSIGNLFGI